MPVMVDGQTVTCPDRDGDHDDEVPQTLLPASAEGRPVSTSRPFPGQSHRVHRRLLDAGYEGIVPVHLSGGPCGTFGRARVARQPVQMPFTRPRPPPVDVEG